MLRIGELATYAGVSTRTVRFYHQQGLLPEPERNLAGYRLYDGDAVLRLSRIVALTSAKVPLARVHELLDASQAVLDAALAEIDAAMRNRIKQLESDRARLGRLRAGDALVLPEVIVGLIEHLRSAGIDQAAVDHYRDAWILSYAVYRHRLDPWVEEFGESMFGDLGYRELMVRSFEAAELDPNDPELVRLAEDSVDWMIAHWETNTLASSLDQGLDDAQANDLLEEQWAYRPAWVRVGGLIMEGLRERGIDHPALDRGSVHER